jgi:hypothetical protein
VQGPSRVKTTRWRGRQAVTDGEPCHRVGGRQTSLQKNVY